MKDFALIALDVAKQIQNDVNEVAKPPAEGGTPKTEQVIPFSIVKGTRRTYIEKVVNQINGAYEVGCYDACAVMIRRLVETLIIEAFEGNNIADNIKDPKSSQGDFFQLNELIARTINESSWNISRTTKVALPKLKDIGDIAAHNRRITAHRSDIDKVIESLRVVAHELLVLAKLK